MISSRTIHFSDPEVLWQSMEKLSDDSFDTGLIEKLIARHGETSFFIGLVTATRERAIWLKMPDRYHMPARPTAIADAVWVKTIDYPDYSLLTVVLTEPAFENAFCEFTRALVQAFNAAAKPAAVLMKMLEQWQKRFTMEWQQAA
jgi:hypothetical protein